MNCVKKLTAASLPFLPALAHAGEADIRIPDLGQTSFLGGALTGHQILWLGLVVFIYDGLRYGGMSGRRFDPGDASLDEVDEPV